MALVAGLAALTVLRLVVAGVSDLTDDETYYRLWSLVLQAGYYDHAPMVAAWIRSGRDLLGDGSLGVRLMAPVSTLLGSLLLWRAVALLDGRATATRAAIWFNAMILVGAGSIVITPDTPSVFFWGATLWAAAEGLASRQPQWWLLVGLTAGLGLASKYTVLFLGPGLVLWLVAVATNRRAFASPWLWAGGALALALFAPVVWWNATHDWVSFAKQFGRSVPHGARPEKIAEMIAVQALLIGLPLMPALVAGVRRDVAGWRAGSAIAALPLATSLPLVLYLLVHAVHGTVEGNWPAPLYPAVAWIAARGGSDLLAAGRPWLRGVTRAAAPIGFGLVGLLYAHVSTDVGALPQHRDPTAQMRGWSRFEDDLDRLKAQSGAAWIAVPSYTLVGRLAPRFGLDRVVQLNERARWSHLPAPDAALLAGPALFVARDRGDPLRPWRDRFAKIEPLGRLERSAGGRVMATYVVYRLAEPVGDPLAAPVAPQPED